MKQRYQKHIITIRQSLADQLVAHAQAVAGECCGFLLGAQNSRISTHVIPAKNTASNPGIEFSIDPLEYMCVERFADENELEVLGIYHSHPNTAALPSASDQLNAHPNLSYVILSVLNGRFADMRSWRLNSRCNFDEEIILS